MFWASCVLGPAAGPNGVSMRSSKMGSAPSWLAVTILRTPKMAPWVLCSSMIQFISCENGIGLMMSLIMSSSL